ncbi:MAG: hypothetical protein ACRD6Q_08535 [Nitrososphaeraceae archaeon]
MVLDTLRTGPGPAHVKPYKQPSSTLKLNSVRRHGKHQRQAVMPTMSGGIMKSGQTPLCNNKRIMNSSYKQEPYV